MEEMFEGLPRQFVVPNGMYQTFERQIEEALRNLSLELPGGPQQFETQHSLMYYEHGANGNRINVYMPRHLLQHCVLFPLDIDENTGVYTVSVRCDIPQYASIRTADVEDFHKEEFTVSIHTREAVVEAEVIDDIAQSTRQTINVVITSAAVGASAALILHISGVGAWAWQHVREAIYTLIPQMHW